MSASRPALLVSLAFWLLVAPAAVARQQSPAEEPSAMLVTGSALLVVDGRESPLPMASTQRGPLFSLQAIVAALGGDLEVGPFGQAHTLKVLGVPLVFGPGNSVMTVGREIVQLSQPPRAGTAGLYVPLELLERAFGEVRGYDLVWSPTDRRLFAMPSSKRDLRVDYNLVHLQGITTLVLRFAEAPRVRIEEGQQQVVVELVGDRVLPPERSSPISDPLVRNVRFFEDRIVVHLAADAVVEHYEQTRPFRLVFDVYRRPAAGPEPERPRIVDRDGDGELRTIVIDPGHGGGETGAVGPSGVEEKELTLLIARSLERRLEARLPVAVELTRDEDADLPLDTRTALANQHRADLFISIHLNSSLGRTAHGAETYFLSLAASDSAAAASAEVENQSATFGDVDPLADLELILWDLAQSQHLAESQRFARLVQEELNEALGLRDRGVKQAPFRVLMGAAMPAVLVELGFISNPGEEAKLLQSSYRQELVDALVRAVERYRSQRLDERAAGTR